MKYKSTELHQVNYLRDEFLQGNNDAFAKLYQALAPALYSMGLSFRIKKDIIEDALHDTFEDIYNQKHNLGKVENVKLYFMSAFRNKLFMLIKKENNTSELDANATLPPNLIEKDHLDSWIEQEKISEQKKLIKKLLDELTPNQREVIFYRFVEGLTLDEISSLMAISYQSVKNLIYRSVTKLKELKDSFLQATK